MKHCAVCGVEFVTGWSTYWCSRPCLSKQVRINRRREDKRWYTVKAREQRHEIKMMKNKT